MTASQERRLVILEERRWRQPPPPAPSAFDSSRLSPHEQLELYELLGPLADGWSVDDLSVEQMERLIALEEKASALTPGMMAPDPSREPAVPWACGCSACGRRRAELRREEETR